MPKRKYTEEYFLKNIKKLRRRLRDYNEERTALEDEATIPAQSPEHKSYDEEIIEEGLIALANIVTETMEQDTIVNDLDKSIINVLGQNHEKPQEMGSKIHSELADRWENIIINGLENMEKENILKQEYCLPPENCPHLTIPEINPEMLTGCSEKAKKRDQLIRDRQKLLSSSIAGLAYATDKVLVSVEPHDLKLSLLGILNNSIKILTDILFSENKSRRTLIISGLDKEFRDTLSDTTPNKYLFGDNLHEKIVTAKLVVKTGHEISLQNKNITKPNPKNSQLNWKGPPRRTQRQMPLEPHTKKNRSGPQIRDTLSDTRHDEYLFGDNLQEKIITAKPMVKTGHKINLQNKNIAKPNPKNYQLNWKGPPRQTERQMPLESRTNKNHSGLQIRHTFLDTRPDKYLFVDNLHEKIITAKSVVKTGCEISLQNKYITKPNPKNSQLNWQGPPRQTQRQMPLEPCTNRNCSGPRYPPRRQASPVSSCSYRKQNSSRNYYHQ